MNETSRNHPEPFLQAQAKREAKRLLRLAQEHAGTLRIDKLNEAQAIVARLWGKADWHDLTQTTEDPRAGAPAPLGFVASVPQLLLSAERDMRLAKTLEAIGTARSRGAGVICLTSYPGLMQYMTATKAAKLEYSVDHTDQHPFWWNPLLGLSAPGVADAVIAGLNRDAGGLWADLAIPLVNMLADALVWLRDNGKIPDLSPAMLQANMTLPAIERLLSQLVALREQEDVPIRLVHRVREFLDGMGSAVKQREERLGFLSMQFTQVLRVMNQMTLHGLLGAIPRAIATKGVIMIQLPETEQPREPGAWDATDMVPRIVLAVIRDQLENAPLRNPNGTLLVISPFAQPALVSSPALRELMHRGRAHSLEIVLVDTPEIDLSSKGGQVIYGNTMPMKL